MTLTVIWVLDTSSIIEVRRSIENSEKQQVFERMGTLVHDGRLVFPKQVVGELQRQADPKCPDMQWQWAKQHERKATERTPPLERVSDVLRVVPTILDADKDTGVEEADPYILAMAVHLHAEGRDARIITQEKKDTPRKISISTAAGLLGLPSVPLMAFLTFEGIH